MSALGRASFTGLAFAMGVWACLARGPATLPLTLDNQHYYFVAERFASGVPPHVSHFDSKNALSMMIEGTAIRAGRALGADDVMAARAASIAATAGAVALAWWLGAAVSGGWLGGHLAALALCGLESFLAMGAMGARPKVFLVFFCLAASAAAAARRPGWTGALGAGAFLCWQPALLVPAAAVPVVAAGPRPGRGLAWLALGFLAPVAGYELYFAAHGALAEQLDQAFRFPALYMAGASSGGPLEHARAFLHLDAPLRQRVLPALGVAALAGVGVLALRAPRRLRDRVRAAPGAAHLALAGGAALAFSLLDYQTEIDAFFVHPYVAVGAGAGSAWLAERATRSRPAALRAGLAALLVVAFAGLSAVRPTRAHVGPSLSDQRQVAAVVREWVEQGHPVWAVGCTHLLALAHLDNHVRYGFFFRGMEGYLREKANAPDGYRPLREGAMPDFVLVSRPFLPGGRSWLEREYEEVSSGVFRRHGIKVWRRRGS